MSVSHIIKPEKSLPMPVVFGALGMALSYYGYPLLVSGLGGVFFLFGILFLLAAAIGFLTALRTFAPGIFPRLGILLIAVSVGFSAGIAVRRSLIGPVQTGISAERVAGVSGILREDPRSLQSGAGMGILELRESFGAGGLRAGASGNLTVFFPADSIPHLQEFGRGSELYVGGTLSYGIRGPVFRSASVHILAPAPPLEQYRTGLRTALLERFQSRQDAQYGEGHAPVWGAFASAMLLGMRDDLDAEFAQAFFNSGCAYILALSGMHLAIISGVLAFLIRRPLGIRGASLIGALFIIVYVFAAGSQPSLVRAAIMYIIGTVAVWGLLNKRILPVLGMAFIIQLLFQRDTGLSLSFMLSYLALSGMVTLGDTFYGLFRGRLPEVLGRALSASLGAFIATAPLVVFVFGSLKPVGIIAGPVVAAGASVFMVLSMGALASAFLPFPLWNLFDFALTWLYRILEFTVSAAAQVPGLSLSSPVPVIVVCGLVWLAVLFVKKQDDSYRNRFAALA